MNKILDRLVLLFTFFICISCQSEFNAKQWNLDETSSDLHFTTLSTTWDEGIPLGNATLGALVWEKDSMLRFSLDRIDLWDLRPTDSLSGPNYNFKWIKDHVRSGDYAPVQQKFDRPYDALPAPSKIPGAAIEFSLKNLGSPQSVHLYLKNALCKLEWNNGTTLHTFVHATRPVGWFVFDNLDSKLEPVLVPPAYGHAEGKVIKNAQAGADLEKLGYKMGDVIQIPHRIIYRQEGWDGFYYDVVVEWMREGQRLYGLWSITSSLCNENGLEEIALAWEKGLVKEYASHLNYWNKFWSQSSVQLPDSIIQKQYENELYKLGSVARENSYPISLQAVWTADNGKLPPWKGDFHHDLNTELSYWPVYTGNHLQEGLGYLNTIWEQKPTYEKYTKEFFGVEGLNIPGVATLDGQPMGGWCQYAMSQTVAAWIAQHFYLHWRYSADRTFLEERAYPFVKEVATFLENISSLNDEGKRTLEFSTSPEIFDNSLKAWFPTMTNFDLSLMKFLFQTADELAGELEFTEEAAHWKEIGNQLPDLDLDAQKALTFASGFPYENSHRHFSHAMAIYPLGLLDWSNGKEDQRIIKETIHKLDHYGPAYWTGYSYSWLANLKARAMDGEGAVKALSTFARCFCLKNTFHANGDQSGTGKSTFTYRPFTLEGNFAFAAGVHEILLQSHTGIIRVFPAVPRRWKNVSFKNLRAEGAFLVSAEKKDGKIASIRIYSEKGGVAKLCCDKDLKSSSETVTREGKIIEVTMNPGECVEFTRH